MKQHLHKFLLLSLVSGALIFDTATLAQTYDNSCPSGNCPAPTAPTNVNNNTNNISNPINNNSSAVTGPVNSYSGSNSSIYQKNISVNSTAGVSGAMVPTAPPSAYAGTGFYNSPWNFIPPNILFHPTKTINDGSCFAKCRLVKVNAPLKTSLRDKIFGVFDEEKFVSSGMGDTRGHMLMGGGSTVTTDSIIVCGLNTELPAGCVKFVGSGTVNMDTYATTEGALVGLGRLAAKNGANLLGNVNCAYAETIKSDNWGVGLGGSITDALGGHSAGSGSIGAQYGSAVTKRPAQPYCAGDFYIATLQACQQPEPVYAPQPRQYRRYLPAPVATQQYLPAPVMQPNYNPHMMPQHQQTIPGRW